MSRSGYNDDCEPLSLGRWRAQVASAIRGKRGQMFLVELLHALDTMEVKELIADELETHGGEVCALGALGKKRGYDMKNIDVEDSDRVAGMFNIAHQLAREVVYMNDEVYFDSPAQRYQSMRAWVANQIKPDQPPSADDEAKDREGE